MRKSICILFILLVSTSLWASEKPEQRIYIIDLSGSMAGYHSTINVFKKEIEQLSNALSLLDSNIEAIVIPFAERPGQTLRGTGQELSEKVKELNVYKGNSDIYSAWSKGLKEIDVSKRSLLFLITDGRQNFGVDKKKLRKKLESFSDLASTTDVKAYYLILDSNYQSNQIAKVFGTKQNMSNIYNLKDIELPTVITKQNKSKKSISKNNIITKTEKRTSRHMPCVLKILISIGIVSIFLICILVFKLRINTFNIKEIKGRFQNRNKIPNNNNGINKEKRTLKGIALNPIVDASAQSVKEISKKIKVPENKVERILKDFSKSRFICSEPKGRHANFAPMAITIGKFPTKEGLQKILQEKKLKPTPENIRAIHYDIARKAFADKYNITSYQAGLIIGALDHTIHEAEDGTIQIVPNSIHDYYKHDGLVSIRVKELTGQTYTENLT
jgi:hypothetical protein